MDRKTYVDHRSLAVGGLAGPGNLGSLVPALGARIGALEEEGRLYRGKVRDRVDLGDRVLLYTSDRVSAFDVVLDRVPLKGEILNGVAHWWFRHLEDLVPHHVIRRVGGRGLLCRKATVLPVEVVVRGYLTGSAWRDYQKGQVVSGIALPPGMKKDQAFPRPLITPSTKEAVGSHDQPISGEEIVARGLVDADLWARVEQAALAIFERGRELCARQGLILVDTKYEFGLVDGELTLVDEVHTPDSSRFWYADEYQSRFDRGEEQKRLDKEYLRSWLMDQGWMGHGEPPAILPEVIDELGWRYVQAYELITGEDLVPWAATPSAEAAEVLATLLD